MLLKFEQFGGTTKNSTSNMHEELSNLYDEYDEEKLTVLYGELDMDELLTQFCRDLYKTYRKETGREGRIITNFEEFSFYRLIMEN